MYFVQYYNKLKTMCVFSKDDICVDIVYRYRYVDIMLDVFVFIADPVSGTAPGVDIV